MEKWEKGFHRTPSWMLRIFVCLRHIAVIYRCSAIVFSSVCVEVTYWEVSSEWRA